MRIETDINTVFYRGFDLEHPEISAGKVYRRHRIRFVPPESVDDLRRLLSEISVKDVAQLDLLRGTERKTADVVIAESVA